MELIKEIEKLKVVPVVVSKTLKEGQEIIDGLMEGGLACAEVTFRTECAKDVILYAKNKYPNALIGAGTIINKEQCLDAVDSGARFIVSPGLVEEVALVCKEKNILYIPGVVTPTEIIKAISLGLTYLKFFPANNFGGLKTIKALASAFPNIKFMPTGGIDLNNIQEFLAFEKIFACGGSFMVKGSKEEIIKKTKEVLDLIK